MVQEVFNEHKLPTEFASKVIENVPSLAWGRGKDCTFAGALEAALAATAHPCKYTDLMGFTALAFRTRWFKGGKGWCPSAAVGEMEEEITAASRATGWPLKIEVHFDEKERPAAARGIIQSINAGKPVAAYNQDLDMAVVYGYGEGGAKLLFRDYNKGDQPLELEIAKIGWLWLIPGEHKEIISREQAAVEGLKMAVHNWRRGTGRAGPGEYWYGPAAYEGWIAVSQRADEISPADKPGAMHANWFCWWSLLDARRAAVAFLREYAGRWPGAAEQSLLSAADLYQQVLDAAKSPDLSRHGCFRGPHAGKSISDWTPDVRQQEAAFLRKAMEFDEAAIAQIEKALSEPGLGRCS